VLCSIGCCRRGSKVFQQGSRNRREEIDVGRRIEFGREVGSDVIEVLGGRFDKVYDGNIGNGVSWVLYVSKSTSACRPLLEISRSRCIQMDSDSTRSQVIYTHDAANDVPPQVVKDQDFPYRLAVRVDDWGRLGEKAIRLVVMLIVRRVRRCLIEVKDFFDRH
jgi:hypothetical protein